MKLVYFQSAETKCKLIEYRFEHLCWYTRQKCKVTKTLKVAKKQVNWQFRGKIFKKMLEILVEKYNIFLIGI